MSNVIISDFVRIYSLVVNRYRFRLPNLRNIHLHRIYHSRSSHNRTYLPPRKIILSFEEFVTSNRANIFL